MKAKQISDSTLKITISVNDLEERGMELTDFIMPKEKTENFFYTMLDELELPDTFKNSGLLSFRVTPKRDHVDIFVTRSDVSTSFNLADFPKIEEMSHLTPEEFFKTLEEAMTANGDQEALQRLAESEERDEQEDNSEDVLDVIHYVLDFEHLEAVIAFAKSVDCLIEASELYKYRNRYRLTVLVNLENRPSSYLDHVYALLLEHAKEAAETRAYLREHAILLREGQVLKEFQEMEG